MLKTAVNMVKILGLLAVLNCRFWDNGGVDGLDFYRIYISNRCNLVQTKNIGNFTDCPRISQHAWCFLAPCD